MSFLLPVVCTLLSASILLGFAPSSWAGHRGKNNPVPPFGPENQLQAQGTQSLRLSDRGSGRGRGNSQEYSREDKNRMEKQYQEWQSLPPEEKEKMRRRMEQWREMPPGDRHRYQQRYQQWQQLSPEERRQLEDQLYRWDRLTPEEQESIRRRFKE